MKKAAFASILSAAALSICISVAYAQGAGQVTIKDQAEYNAYTNAESQTTPATKAAAIEAFLQTYPNSVVKDALLQELITAYAQVPDAAKAVDASDRVLKNNPNDLRALTMEAALKRGMADQATDPAAKQAMLDDAAASAKRALQATKPIGMPDADFQKMKTNASPYFYGAIAADADGKKDYSSAITNYMAELKSMPEDQTKVPGPALVDTFGLALDYYRALPVVTLSGPGTGAAASATIANGAVTAMSVDMSGTGYTTAPTVAISGTGSGAAATATVTEKGEVKDITVTSGGAGYLSAQTAYLNCAFYAARAANYAPEPYKTQMMQQANYCYKKYHGTPDHDTQPLDKLVTVAAANLFAPADLSTQFTAAPPPPKPADLAHQAIVSTTDLTTLALQDKEFILGNARQEDADKLWAVMNGVTTEIPGTVVEATADKIELSVSDDAIQGKTADFTINMKTPLKEVPATGASIKVIATFDSYTRTPTMIIMKDGEIPEKPKAAKPVAKKAPVHHTAAH
jgi:hypothetical protein